MSGPDRRKRSLLRRILNYELISDRTLSKFGLGRGNEETVERFRNFLVVCIFTFFTHLLVGFGAGALLGCTLGWHWSPDTGPDRWRTASLAGLSCGFLGAWVNWSLPGFDYIDIDEKMLPVFLYGVVPLAALGTAAARIDHRRNSQGIFTSLWWRPLGYIIFACSLALATFFGVCLVLAPKTAPVNWATVGCVLMAAGAALSVMEQIVTRRRISLLEVFVVSSLFGAFIAPALILVVTTEKNLPPLAACIAVGAGLWVYDRHRRRLRVSIVHTILNGFACGYVALIYLQILLAEELHGIPAVIGALGGVFVAVGLAEPLTRKRKKFVIWNPIVLSPLPLAALGAYIGRIVSVVIF